MIVLLLTLLNDQYGLLYCIDPFTIWVLQINSLNAETNSLIEKRMMRNDPIDDKLSLFRQQAVIIAGKKETAAEAFKEAKDELQQVQQELQEKQAAAKDLGSEEVLKGDDVSL